MNKLNRRELLRAEKSLFARSFALQTIDKPDEFGYNISKVTVLQIPARIKKDERKYFVSILVFTE